MFRYYMTPETRQALIAESNRLIAGRRAAMNAAREGREAIDEGERLEGEAPDAKAFADTVPCGSERTFARLVADLQSTAAAAESLRG